MGKLDFQAAVSPFHGPTNCILNYDSAVGDSSTVITPQDSYPRPLQRTLLLTIPVPTIPTIVKNKEQHRASKEDIQLHCFHNQET
jgi:hypothetical protein